MTLPGLVHASGTAWRSSRDATESAVLWRDLARLLLGITTPHLSSFWKI